MEALKQFAADYTPYILTIHILGTAIGLGGATISDILFFRFLKDFRISKKEEEVLNIMKSIVLSGLGLLIISGSLLFLAKSQTYLNSPEFLAKTLGVAVLTVNGVALHVFVAPHLLQINLKQKRISRGWHRLAFSLGSISLISWYFVFTLAMLKSEINYSLDQLVSFYLGFLAIGITASQITESLLCRFAKNKSYCKE